MEELNRRDFVKLAAGAGSGALMPQPLKVLRDAIDQIIGSKKEDGIDYLCNSRDPLLREGRSCNQSIATFLTFIFTLWRL